MLIQSFKPTHWLAGIALSTLLVACSSQTPKESVEDAPSKPKVRIKLTQPSAPSTTPSTMQPNMAFEEIAQLGMGAVVPMGIRVKLRSHSAQLAPLADQGTGFYQDPGRGNYQNVEINGVKWAAQTPVSTFSVDVDSAAYANMRRQLNQGQLPHPDFIRVEELVNYFSYNYRRAEDLQTPFSIFTEMGPSPRHSERKLEHIGINGWQDDNHSLPPSNLVFLIDVSGSMQAPNKIQLLKSAMKMMVKQLRPQDSVAIAAYAGAAGQVLAPTTGDQKATITQAIVNLVARGSTNGAAGIRLAYRLARQNFKKGGVNRVLLATDGDFNVGTTNLNNLEKLVETERKSGVALTVLGFVTTNYNDHLMQKIAQIGNGNAVYIDTINEARKVLVEELGATLNVIAKDMKVQVEFNPAVVETYRLIGYESRHLNREDFNNDKVDAGDVGAGNTVTALYEAILTGEPSTVTDPLRYQQNDRAAANTSELANLKLRYKQPNQSASRLLERPLMVAHIRNSLAKTSSAFQFAAAVAWLGQHLSDSNHVQNDRVQDMISLSLTAKGSDPHGYRSEFINLLRTVDALSVASSEQSETDDHS